MKTRRISNLFLLLCIGTATSGVAAETLVSRANCPAPGVWTQTGMSGRLPIGTCTGIAEPASAALALCSAPPVIEAAPNSPSSILVKSGATVSVAVAGSVTNGAGCTIKSSEFRLVDEYGEISATLAFAVAPDGRFAFSVPVEASRKGSDLDGRTYTITVSASNEAGVASSAPIVSTVAHDNRVNKP